MVERQKRANCRKEHGNYMPRDGHSIAEQWALEDGEERRFGFVQTDWAEHWPRISNPLQMKRTLDKLRASVSGLLEATYNGWELDWSADGGRYAFYLRNLNEDVDWMVMAAFNVLEQAGFLNHAKGFFDLAEHAIVLRVSCHQGFAVFSLDRETMTGKCMDFFFKDERSIGVKDAVTITQKVYDYLVRQGLKKLFRSWKVLPPKLPEQPQPMRIYVGRLPLGQLYEVGDPEKRSLAEKELQTLEDSYESLRFDEHSGLLKGAMGRRLGDLFRLEGKYKDAKRYFEANLGYYGDRPTETLEMARAEADLSSIFELEGDFKQASKFARQAVERISRVAKLVDPGGREIRAWCRLRWGIALRRQGKLGDAKEQLKAGYKDARRLGDTYVRVQLELARGDTWRAKRNLGMAGRWYRRALGTVLRMGAPGSQFRPLRYLLASSHYALGRIRLMQGPPEDAYADLATALDTFRQLEMPPGTEIAAQLMGRMFRALHVEEEARRHFRESLDASEATGNILRKVETLYQLAELEYDSRHPDEAARYVDQALAVSESEGYWNYSSRFHLLQAFLLLPGGSVPEAANHLLTSLAHSLRFNLFMRDEILERLQSSLDKDISVEARDLWESVLDICLQKWVTDDLGSEACSLEREMLAQAKKEGKEARTVAERLGAILSRLRSLKQ